MADLSNIEPILGKSIWIWVLDDCLGGSVSAIIQKCKDNNITSLIIKGADGHYGWSQFTQELVDEIHQSGLKIFSWSYCYGADPVAEANLAIALLDHGVDGHIIDAESEYEHQANPAVSANIMMTAIRAKHPNALIGYAPFPIIDGHKAFPYVQFNQYCDFVMPQVYWNDWKMSPIDAINWMFTQWLKWQDTWKNENLENANIPIIPLGSFYDNSDIKPEYVLSPADIISFIQGVAGYFGVSIWSFQHIIRPDCWQAIGQTNVNSLPTPKLAVTPAATANSVPAPLTGPTNFLQSQIPADIFNSTNGDIKTYNGQQVVVTVNNNNTRTLTPYIPPIAPENIPTPVVTTSAFIVTPPPAKTSLTPDEPSTQPIVIPSGKKVNITVSNPSNKPGVVVSVHDKVLIDYIEDFLNWLFRRG